jgi:Uma2 family endonuclease
MRARANVLDLNSGDLGPEEHATTMAADGLPRRAWSSQDIEKMLEAGNLQHGERPELLGGELVAMWPNGRHHELLKIDLNEHWNRTKPDHVRIAPEATFRLDTYQEPEPDFLIYPATLKAPNVRGDTALLVVEIANSSMAYDLGLKAAIYAKYGVRDYWVMNAVSRMTTVFREPGETGYAARSEVPGDMPLVPLLVPELALRLDDFGQE